MTPTAMDRKTAIQKIWGVDEYIDASYPVAGAPWDARTDIVSSEKHTMSAILMSLVFTKRALFSTAFTIFKLRFNSIP
jgi:hypothetical protein